MLLPNHEIVVMLKNSLGDEAMRLYDGFQFATPQEHHTTVEILSAFDEFAIGEANETFERRKLRRFPYRSTRVGKNLQRMSSRRKLDEKR